ncbi:hypothetical protein HZS_8144, partial [Henneguya salminicola]
MFTCLCLRLINFMVKTGLVFFTISWIFYNDWYKFEKITNTTSNDIYTIGLVENCHNDICQSNLPAIEKTLLLLQIVAFLYIICLYFEVLLIIINFFVNILTYAVVIFSDITFIVSVLLMLLSQILLNKYRISNNFIEVEGQSFAENTSNL